MKKERMIAWFLMGLLLNYCVHHQIAPVLYFGSVYVGLMMMYRLIDFHSLLEQTFLRFAVVLLMSWGTSISLLEVSALFVLCSVSSTMSQRIQKSELLYLERLQTVNVVLCCFIISILAILLSGGSLHICARILLFVAILFQPSGLSIPLLYHPNEKMG